MNRMFSCLIFVLLSASVVADASWYSYSPFRGSSLGQETTLRGRGRITAVRMWSGSNNFIYGLQLRFGPVWSRTAGRSVGTRQEIQLFDGESIVQVSGKYGRFINQLIFVTSRGRFLMAGQPKFRSFNMYAEHKDAELIFLGVRSRRALTAVAAHWTVVSQDMW